MSLNVNMHGKLAFDELNQEIKWFYLALFALLRNKSRP